MNKELTKYFAEIGRKGGSVKSPAKTASAKNALRIRWEKWRAKHGEK